MMPYAYFCESCEEEISQHAGVTANHEKACFKRRLLTHPWQPVATPEARVLILGTFPSAASVEYGGYCGNPDNHFWKIMGKVLDSPMIALRVGPSATDPFAVPNWDYRYMILKSKGIALWDVVASCERKGRSSDSELRDITPNPIGEFLHDHPEVRTVVLNGRTAEKLYHQFITPPYPAPRAVYCPSTSPRNAMPYAKKLRAWRRTFRTALPKREFDPVPFAAVNKGGLFCKHGQLIVSLPGHAKCPQCHP